MLKTRICLFEDQRSRIQYTVQNVPSETAFRESHVPLTTTGYLPIINLPVHEDDTLWTIMRALQIYRKPWSSTMSTGLWMNSCTTKLKSFNGRIQKHEQLVIGFHILLTYQQVISKHFKCSGLEDLWVVESSVEKTQPTTTWMESSTTALSVS